MGQSLSRIYIHATFGTKFRTEFIKEEIAPQLHEYMAGIFIQLDSPALIINSMPDHIHTLFRLSKNITVAKLMEEVKKSSSKWMKRQPEMINTFYWQKGYGAFAVNDSHVDMVTRYIAHQKKHHETMTYKEEVEKLMAKYNVNEYNPDFYWD